MTKNERAFLDMIAWAEGTAIIPNSDNGYKVLVGSTIKIPLLFNSYLNHPGIYNKTLNSTAAGRYQILERYYYAYKRGLGLSDFSPDSQDKIAMQMIRECHAIAAINNGDIEKAIQLCASRWASFPSNLYANQPKRKLANLLTTYVSAGGVLKEGLIA